MILKDRRECGAHASGPNGSAQRAGKSLLFFTRGGLIMFRKYLTTAGFAALAAAGLLLPAEPAWAQQGWPINGSNWDTRGGGGYRGGGYGFRSRGYSSGYFSPGPAYTYPAPTYAYYSTSMYYETAVEVKGPRAAEIAVSLPKGATISFDDKPTSQTGDLRRFVSPPLEADRNYIYLLKVRWQENGRDVTRTREVEVHAGDRLNLAFGPTAAETAQR
jgi:uncharacterized protein (TIGR03000 family)